MKNETAKQKLFEEMDKLFIKYGSDAGMCNPGFYPHYSEVKSDTMRPTWYTKYDIDQETTLITMYENIRDLAISTLFVKGQEAKAALHTGYPKSIEDAKTIIAKLFP